MKAPIIDDEGRVDLKPEELYVMEHPSFAKVLDEIRDLIDEKDSDDITHVPEYVPIPPKLDPADRLESDVRLVKYLGTTEETPDWRKSLDVNRISPLSPRLSWQGAQSDMEVETRLREAFRALEVPGLEFKLLSEPTYHDFELVLGHAYVEPMLRTLGAGFHHRPAVKGVVREFLERKAFALPAGVRPSLDSAADPDVVKIALGNLGRAEVISRVREALVPVLRDAMTAMRPISRVQLSETHASELPGYSAIRRNVIERLRHSPFERQAAANDLEERVARWIESGTDTTGWVYNHRRGVGYSIEYVWRDVKALYFPDFIARGKWGDVVHNFIIEAKGRMDFRDRAKAVAAVQFCEMLTMNDVEPWHYILIIEEPSLGRNDMTALESTSTHSLAFAWAEQERRGILPGAAIHPGLSGVNVEEDVEEGTKWRSAVPVYDVSPQAGSFGPSQEVAPRGWVRLRSARRLDRSLFAARVQGKSMEPGIPDGSWCLFRSYAAGTAPSPMQLDGRRVVVELRDGTDPESGGRYTLKRMRVGHLDEGGHPMEIELLPDNRHFPRRVLSSADQAVRIVAELLEVIG